MNIKNNSAFNTNSSFGIWQFSQADDQLWVIGFGCIAINSIPAKTRTLYHHFCITSINSLNFLSKIFLHNRSKIIYEHYHTKTIYIRKKTKLTCVKNFYFFQEARVV